ncbi:hypothetical protein [Veillonella sp. CHU732]|uniref:hypothetical protein n=1 Tax=Veillonella sp. CHU732 TaxID=2490949 RepID=UPI000F8ED76F|nr:hypothetical protein [Veillonella sp. CHU732]
MTSWFSDLKELILHPTGQGADQVAQYGTIKKGLLTFFGLEFLFCTLLGAIVTPLVGFFMPVHYLDIAAYGSLIIVAAAILIFIVQIVSIFFSSAIFYGLYKLTKSTGTWADVVKGFMYGKIFSDLYIACLIPILWILGGLLLPLSRDLIWLLVIVAAAVALWIVYVEVHIMSRILDSTKLKVFALYVGVAIVSTCIKYLLGS